MRINPVKQMIMSRRSSQRTEGDVAAEQAARTRALLPAPAAAHAREEPRRQWAYRQSAVNAALVAHLIATREGMAQTRTLRRASSGEGAAAYGAVRGVVRAVPQRQGFVTTA